MHGMERPFPARVKYVWNVRIGVSLNSGVQNDYVMAGIYTWIYMGIICSLYTQQLHNFAGCDLLVGVEKTMC